MIQRTNLPNLALKNKNKIIKSQILRTQQTSKYNTQNTRYGRSAQNQSFLQPSAQNKLSNFQSLNKIQIPKRNLNRHHYTEQQAQSKSQMKTLEIKSSYNPQVLNHDEVKKSARQSNSNDIKENAKKNNYEKVSPAPYFFRIRNSLNMLENETKNIQKINQIEPLKIGRQSTENSMKKLTNIACLNQFKHQSSVQQRISRHTGSLSKRSNYSSCTNNLPITSVKKRHLTEEQTLKEQKPFTSNLYHAQQKLKAILTQKILSSNYSFKHFNSGQVFNQIAEINSKQRLKTTQNIQGTSHGTNSIDASKILSRKLRIQQLQEENFKEEYNSFLKSKMPLSFGENSLNKGDIYEQYAVKGRQHLNIQESDGKTKNQYIFGTQIKLISQKKLQMEELFQMEVKNKDEKAVRDQINKNFIKNHSTVVTSKMATQNNTKLNTLRVGQSLMSKVKLKKLAKLQLKQKAFQQRVSSKNSGQQLNGNQKSRFPKDKVARHKLSSTFLNYKNVSEQQVSKFLQKSSFILGKQSCASPMHKSSDIVSISLNKSLKATVSLQSIFMGQSSFSKNDNPQQTSPNIDQVNCKQKLNKTDQINEFEMKHLENVDKLLGKWVSQRQSAKKQDLDSLPWRIVGKGG